MELVAVLVAEELALLLRAQVDLAEQHRFPVAPPDEAPQVAQQLVRVLTASLGDTGRLDQERDRVDAKPTQPLLEPEAGHLSDLVADLRVGHVEVRLVGVEAVQVPPGGVLIESPVGLLLVGKHDVAGFLLGLLVPPDIEVVEG
jgi:hypothetical protein